MRAYKFIFKSVVALVVLIAIYFFGFTDSYKTSLKAKLKYIEGDYIEAKKLAREAFDADPYNRMASGILAQSKISVEFVDYINDAKRYFAKIKKITDKESLSNQDKIRIKMMCEVMLGRYKKLNATVMTDKDLKKSAYEYYQKFKSINEKLISEKE